MSPFETEVLALPAALILMVVILTTIKFTKSLSVAIACGFVKAGLFLFYFAVMFDGFYTAEDDLTYLFKSQELLHQGVTLANLPDMWEFVLATARGQHVVYYLYNAVSQDWFGEGYYAPVALNVIVTALIAYYGARLAVVEFGLQQTSSRLFYIFLLLHPDILTWSTVVNGKDILVLFQHVLLLTAVSLLLRGNVARAIALAAPVVLVLFFLRFYVPLVIATAFASALGGRHVWRRKKLLIAGLLLVVGALAWIGPDTLLQILNSLRSNFVNPLFGFVRAILTPIPFNSDPEFGFLNPSALIHWLLIPFAVVGFYCVYLMQSPFSRVFVFYLVFFVGLYAVYGELQGPRHRVQLDYALALLQFVGIASALKLTFRPFKYSANSMAA